jgi:hypothetical protein
MIWDNYGLYASGAFDSLPQNGQTVRYDFRIYRKNYKGTVYDLACASDAIIHRYLTDDPVAPIKGSEIELNLINSGSTPLSLFYSEEDDTYKIEVDATFDEYDAISGSITVTKTIFSGYLVQEDCTEVLNDFVHEIKLVWTDNLGVIKDLDFESANKVSPPLATAQRQDIMAVSILEENYSLNIGERLYVSKTTGSPQIGDFVIVQRAGERNGTYQILKIEPHPTLPGYWLYIKEKPKGANLSSTSALVTYITASDIYWRIKLSDCIRICLNGTGLPLEIFYQGSLTAVYNTTVYSKFLENVYVDARTFLNNGTWDSCYTVLEKICTKFGLTIFQADNKWHIVRWNELRYYSNQMTVYKYDRYFTYVGSQSSYNKIFNLAHGEVEAGASETLVRPYQFYAENFKYEALSNNLLNGNLQSLGVFIRRTSFTTDGVAYYDYEYEAPGYDLIAGLANTYEVHIHIIKKQVDLSEVDRFLRIRQITGTAAVERKVIRTNKIEVNEGDRIKITYQSNPWNTGGANIYTFFQVEKGTASADKYFINGVKNDDDQNGWTDLTSLNFSSPALRPPYRPSSSSLYGFLPENAKVPATANDIVIDSEAIPFDGIFYIYLGINSIQDPALHDYRNLNVEIIPATEGTPDLIGHLNKAFISKTIKNTKTADIYLDSNIKNYRRGTLFFNVLQNLINVRATIWRDGITATDYNLGTITTEQMEYYKDKVRSKLELNFFPLIKTNFERTTFFNVINFAPKSDRYYIFGKADFNLRTNQCQATLYEMWKTGEAGSQGIATDPEIKYEFKYLYK